MGGGVTADICLRDESLGDAANLPAPEVIAQEIVEDPEVALAEFATVAGTLAARDVGSEGWKE